MSAHPNLQQIRHLGDGAYVNGRPITSEQASAVYRTWAQAFVLPELRELLPDREPTNTMAEERDRKP
jgi:hypothetical protein